jgi:hypothetical protein
VRYERERPGAFIHLDIKKLAKIVKVGHRITGDRRDTTEGAGREYVHVAIDNASRLAYVEVLANEQATTTVRFFRRHGLPNGATLTEDGIEAVLAVLRLLSAAEGKRRS